MRPSEEPADTRDEVPLPAALRGMRRFPLDGALLLFDRDTGWCVLCDGPETAHLRQLAPRFVQFGITNACNLACAFCSRDRAARSEWTAATAFALLRDLAAAGVLEVAFGGGEPFVFPGMAALVARLHDETQLAVNLTTNGLLLSRDVLAQIAGRYGQLRLSLYDDNDWRERVRLLAGEGARFGVNLLVTPARLPALEVTVLELVALGCTDALLLSYNGRDRALHLDATATADLEQRVGALAEALRGRAELKLDVCWGDRLEAVPRLFGGRRGDDCGAGNEFVVVTSDRQLKPCSFHHEGWPIATAADVLGVWRRERERRTPARDPGCARLSDFGLPGHERPRREVAAEVS